MSSNRFKMSFNNNNNVPALYRQLSGALSVPSQIQTNSKSFALSSPMINRIHTAKPGCSACGKKVM